MPLSLHTTDGREPWTARSCPVYDTKKSHDRFVGLSRTCSSFDQEHLQTICMRETNMLLAIEHISAGSSGTGSPHTATSDLHAKASSNGDGTPVKIPTSTRSDGAAAMDVTEISPPKGSTADSTSPMKSSNLGLEPASAELGTGAGAALDKTQGWKKEIAPFLSPPARRYAMAYLATTTRQTIQKKGGQAQMARQAFSVRVVWVTSALMFIVLVVGPVRTVLFETHVVRYAE